VRSRHLVLAVRSAQTLIDSTRLRVPVQCARLDALPSASGWEDDDRTT